MFIVLAGTDLFRCLSETVGKDFFRLGNEVDFRGKKSQSVVFLLYYFFLAKLHFLSLLQRLAPLGLYGCQDDHVNEGLIQCTIPNRRLCRA